MSIKNYFPERKSYDPKIYGYEDLVDKGLKGWIKVGETLRDVNVRVKQQYPTNRPTAKPYKIVFCESSMRDDGSTFRDKAVLNLLKKKDFQVEGEWAKIKISDLAAAYKSLKDGTEFDANRNLDFKMRPEQENAVNTTINFIKKLKISNPRDEGRFLWNAKMRFGKTFAAYQLAKKMKWKKILILTWQPVVQHSWETDLNRHIDFKGWQFISKDDLRNDIQITNSKPIVCFGSFQDFLGKNEYGGIKSKNEWVHAKNWDCIIYDECHYGAWNDNSKELTDNSDKEEKSEILFLKGSRDYYDHDLMPITGNFHLYLSGTPFRALSNGEFVDDQIFNWSYIDEQREKVNFKGDLNPYKSLPRINLLTYQLPQEIIEITNKGEFDEFNLSEFFSAEGDATNAKFKYEDQVQKWLNFISGNYAPQRYQDLKIKQLKAPLPFSELSLLSSLTHTFWFLPSVASCYAMENILQNKNNTFYHDYKIVCAAGSRAGVGSKALKPVHAAMEPDPLKTKTITLSCRKLHSGVSVSPWTGVFMLRNLNSPEMYFQTAFRVQTPWTIRNSDITNNNNEEIIKEECYIFDFAPHRALRQLSSYAIQIDPDPEKDDETKVKEFINFLPVLAYEEGQLKLINASGILERAMSGTSATLLAKKWTSSSLINLDDSVLSRILNDTKAMSSLSRLEDFRNLNDEIEVIINSSKKIKEIKRDKNDDGNSDKKTELTKEQKEYRNARKELTNKFKKLASRIPVFMYLTDYRERTLKDIIKELDPGLFQKVTGLSEKEFDHLQSLGIFNSSLMNVAVGDFKRCEDRSLSYSGIFKHEGLDVGLWETVISDEEYKSTF